MSPKNKRRDKKEINAVVLDYLPHGYEDDKRPMPQREPVIIAVGTEQFKFFELIAKPDRAINPQDIVYIGDGERKDVERVKRRISYDELTQTAKKELKDAIEECVAANEQKYVAFYNTSRYFSLTKHMLHLLGYSTQKVTAIVKEREKKQFASLADIKARVKSSKTPEEHISERVLLELTNPNEKHRLFTIK